MTERAIMYIVTLLAIVIISIVLCIKKGPIVEIKKIEDSNKSKKSTKKKGDK